MASTFSDVTAVLSTYFTAKLADQRNMSARELGWLNVVPNDSGQAITWSAKFNGTKATTVFAEGSDVDGAEYTKTSKEKATLSYGNYRSPASITDLAAILSFAAEGSPDDMRRLVDSEVNDSLRDITKRIAVDFYTGDGDEGGNPTIIGLTGGAALNTGIYAGINRSSQVAWKANILDNGSVNRPITDALLRQAENLVFNASDSAPNMIITTAAIHTKYAGLFAAPYRINSMGPMPTELGMGTNELSWGGMPVRRSSRAPSGKLFMFNTDDVEFVFPREMLPFASVPQNPMVKMLGLDLKQQYMLPIVVEPLARTGNAQKYNVWTHVQVRVKNPNRVVTISDISET
jgi:hypothetical protein